MKRSKKALPLSFILVMCAFFVLTLLACAPDEPNHRHRFASWKNAGSDQTPCHQRNYSRTCIDCGEVEWKVGKEDDHDYKVEKKTATCLENGYDLKTCKICGDSVSTNNEVAKGHEWKETFSYDGQDHWLECKNCDLIKDKNVHAKDADGVCETCDVFIESSADIIYKLSDDGSYYKVIGYLGAEENIEINNVISGKPVLSIENDAFEGVNIKSVYIPDSVENIGKTAFTLCQSITSFEVSINNEFYRSWKDVLYSKDGSILIQYPIGKAESYFDIPWHVSAIDDMAFYGCKLETVSFCESLGYIGEMAFFSSYMLEAVSLVEDRNSSQAVPPKSFKIGSSAFAYCGNLSRVDIPDGIESIGDNAFNNCMVRSLTIPDSVTSIGEKAFYSCRQLTNVIMGSGVTNIGDRIFDSCNRLQSVYFNGDYNAWSLITVGANNQTLVENIYYYSQNTPTAEGNYWHYDENGNAVKW